MQEKDVYDVYDVFSTLRRGIGMRGTQIKKYFVEGRLAATLLAFTSLS